MCHARHILHRLARKQSLDSLAQLIMLSLVNAQVGIHQLLVPIDVEEVFQKDAHQLLRLAPGELFGQQVDEITFRFCQIKSNHGAKLRKKPYLCSQFFNRPFDKLRDLATSMIYLILAIIFSTGVFVAMRLFERFNLDNHQALMWNYVFAASTGFLMCKQFDSPAQLVDEPWFGLSLMTGFWFIFTYVLMTASTQRSGVTITSLSSKLSVVLPTLAGVVLFNERLNFVATMGIVLALVALVLVVGGKKEINQGDTINRVSTNRILPLLIFSGTGTGDILMKLNEQRNQGDDMSFMIAFIYFIALLFGILLVVYDLIRGNSKWQWKSAIGGIGLGVINFFSTYNVFHAMRCFDNVVLFPVYNIGVVSLTALTGWLLFKEKLTWKNYLGLAIAIIAVILITLKP